VQAPQIDYSGIVKRSQLSYAVAPNWKPSLVNTTYGQGRAIALIQGNDPLGQFFNVGLWELIFMPNNGSWEFLSNGSTANAPFGQLQQAGLPKAAKFNVGDIRFSNDGKVIVSADENSWNAKYDGGGFVVDKAFSSTLTPNFDVIVPSESFGAEVISLPNGQYRIFILVKENGNFLIKEHNFNPVTRTVTATATIATLSNRTNFNRDQYQRLVWSQGTVIRAYLPGNNAVGTGTTYTISVPSQPITNAIQPPLNLLEYYHIPYVIQGGALLAGNSLTSNCCERSAPDHWENTSASALGLASSVSNRTITIDGVFQVNQNLTLINCQVYLRPNARIQVSPGVHLQINWSKLEACKDMWDGIYLDHPTARITVLNQGWNNAPYIKHAINGIVVSNGAQFTLTNANLLDNYRHLQVRNWTGNYANSITGTEFGCLAAGIGRVPHSADITVAAVTLTNGGSINLGVTSLLTPSHVNRNEIYQAVDGIFVDHASTEFNNWDMHDLSRDGVYAQRGGTGYFVNSNFLNVIERMQVGIAVLGQQGVYNVSLTGNRVGDLTNTGIYVGNCNLNNTISIEGNEVKTAPKAGIWVSNSGDSWVEIIQNQVTTAAQTYVNSGILVMDPFTPPTNGLARTTIYNNTVTNYFSGIFVQNDASPQIYGNTVAINAATSSTGKGSAIFARACPGTTIYDNSTNTVTNAFMTSKFGIGIESSPTSRIYNNIVKNTSDGIYISANCFPTRYYCNDLIGYWRGVVYNFALVGPQGTSTNPQGNEWYPTSGAFDTYSFNTNAAQWPFFAQTMTLPLRPQNNGFFGLQAISPSWTSSSASCGLTLSSSLDPIVNGNQGFESWDNDQVDNANFWALKSLYRDEDLLNLGQSYKGYRENWEGTSLGLINAYIMAVEDGDAYQANLLYNGLLGNTATETNFLVSTAAYDNKFVSGTINVNEGLMADIAAVGSSRPTSAALLARWLLCDQAAVPGYFAVQDESEVLEKAESSGVRFTPATEQLRVSPVPAKETLQIAIEGVAAKGEVLSIEGRTLAIFPLQEGTQSISRNGLPAGIYYLRVTFQNGMTRVEKIVFQ
jgi:hypothetical protein